MLYKFNCIIFILIYLNYLYIHILLCLCNFIVMTINIYYYSSLSNRAYILNDSQLRRVVLKKCRPCWSVPGWREVVATHPLDEAPQERGPRPPPLRPSFLNSLTSGQPADRVTFLFLRNRKRE